MIQQLADAAADAPGMQKLRVHSPGGITFPHEMTPSSKYDVISQIRLRRSIVRIYLKLVTTSRCTKQDTCLISIEDSKSSMLSRMVTWPMTSRDRMMS